ncbi:MAG: HAMP domain-containing histidine kinase [Cyclobacteriaceae bacterium]|nr:HAMP domain-containing histidine kinase [Cyclobacteriaceae bacterium]
MKWIVLLIAAVISAASIYYTDYLVNKLKEREIKSIEVFASSMEYTIENDVSDQLPSVIREIIVNNDEIPLIYVNSNDEIESWRNIEIDKNWSEEKKQNLLRKELEIMKDAYAPKHVFDRDEQTGEILDFWFIYYRNSFLLTQLTYYPIIQLAIIGVFGLIVYFIFSYSKTAEQNRVWVGLAKETAHQLGTPISSLMAWVEYFREDPGVKNKGVVEEINKDIKKLQLITERFSNIGSTPVLKEEKIEEIINNVVEYLKPRISTKINIEVISISDGVRANLNAPLFEWVLENLCKNSVDAMAGIGNIQIKILHGSDYRVFIDVSDTGKGIAKSKIKHVFNPGFSTKKRGWGLGLTLAKRIIETYHKGKIFVKSSEENEGTTFRIVLNS